MEKNDWRAATDDDEHYAYTIALGRQNVRLYGRGAPNVFLDEAGRATKDKLTQLLEWS